MTNFFDTALGKSFETTLWLAGSYLAAWAVAYSSSHKFTGIWVVLPGVINLIAYTFTTIKDPRVPTTPSSTPMLVVPKVNPVVLPPTPAPVSTPIVVTEPLVPSPPSVAN